MKISRDKIVAMLRGEGDGERADRAERELPELVDGDRDAGALERLGLDPEELVQRLAGEGIPRLS